LFGAASLLAVFWFAAEEGFLMGISGGVRDHDSLSRLSETIIVDAGQNRIRRHPYQ
jgi:hypothetical protein